MATATDLKTVLGQIETSIEADGYVYSRESFDFDTTPSTVADKIYRIEIASGPNLEMSSMRVRKQKTITVYVARYLSAAADNTATAAKSFLGTLADTHEEIEDAVLTALTGIVSVIASGATSKTSDRWVVCAVEASFTYERLLS